VSEKSVKVAKWQSGYWLLAIVSCIDHVNACNNTIVALQKG